MATLKALLNDYLVPLAQLVGVCLSFVTVRYAFKAVELTRSLLEEQKEFRRQERASKRPYLTIPATGIIHSLDPGPRRLETKIENVGVHPASRIEADIRFLNDTMSSETRSTFTCANDLAGGNSFSPITVIQIPGDKFPCYVALALKYDDGITRERFGDTFFFKWRSFPDQSLHHAKQDEKESILDALQKFDGSSTRAKERRGNS